MSRLLAGDLTQESLARHLAATESSLRTELRRLDPRADCEIVPAADLGIPYDALRLSGGFATGCFVQWQCSTPIIPIDTTMNVDTSSVFWVSEAAESAFTKGNLSKLRQVLESKTNYEWNFDSSNHFITLGRDTLSDALVLVIHSNEKEFKNQYHGLCPTEGNWFEKDIRVSSNGRVRLITGRAAELFAGTAKMLEPFNIARHRFVAHELLGPSVDVLKEVHEHHYYMPTESSAALGCYVAVPGAQVPIFSQHGRPIIMYEALGGGPNMVSVGGHDRCIVPHGWGMTLDEPFEMKISSDYLTFQGIDYPRRPGVSLLDHPSVRARTFSNVEAFLHAVSDACPGRKVAEFRQIRSLTRNGFLRHELSSMMEVPPSAK